MNGTGKGILIDVSRCTGCETCIAACKRENGLGKDRPWKGQEAIDSLSATRWSTILRRPGGHFVRNQCRHCIEPACVSACIVGALHRTSEGAVVYAIALDGVHVRPAREPLPAVLRHEAGPYPYVYDVKFSPSGRHLASAVWDGAVRIWDTTTGSDPSTTVFSAILLETAERQPQLPNLVCVPVEVAGSRRSSSVTSLMLGPLRRRCRSR